ncbi:MAG: murein biosynthesis integral membrane protein MurJ [Candidatus Omnitrophica bacterium]|nr:murein biosynthesis integral membrane protein MurJ [Candidatus Omnitrophota bacterium]
MFKKVIKNTSILSAGTLLSRFLGFIRDILIANFFGTTSPILEAFLVAFRLPNIFRSIFAEGFTDSVATPVLSEYRNDKEKVFAVGNHLLFMFFILLSCFTFLGIIFSRYLVLAIAPGYAANVYKFNLAVSFTKITFVYLLLIGLSSIVVSQLYTLKKFLIPAINPVFLNITFIPGIILFGNAFKTHILVVCVLVAGILELIFPLAALRREGFKLELLRNLRHIFKSLKEAFTDSTILRMLKLFLPRIWSSIIYHLNVFLDTILASLTRITGAGALAGIYFANRLIQFPFALIALAIAPVVIVDFSAYHKEGNVEDFKRLLVFSLQNIIFFIVPISFIFIFIPDAIIDILFKRGEFTDISLSITSSIFFFYSLGLFFMCAIKLFVTTFYSLKDTATPAKTATIGLIANGIFSAILMFPLKAGGLALGTTLAAALNFFLLYRAITKRIGKLEWADTKQQLIKIFLLSLMLGLLARFLWLNLHCNKYISGAIIACSCFGLFAGLGFLLGFKQIIYAKQWILKRK